ncbi:MAG: AMP-binding protein, partial [Chloroflexi bacterium]|nr:AMP-binding protein [Chloroflexota bacterium]
MGQHRLLTIGDALRAQVDADPDHIALIFVLSDGRHEQITYDRLYSDALRCAAWLRGEGIAGGDCVLLAFDHGYSLVRAFLGAILAGVIPTIYPYLSAYSDTGVYSERLGLLLKSIDARRVIAAPEDCPYLRSAVASTGRGVLALPHSEDLTSEADEPSCDDPLRPAYLQFSSGTTGAPKGVVVDHRMVITNVSALVASQLFSERQVSVGWMPLYHDGGLMTLIWMPLIMGGTSVLVDARHWLRRPRVLFELIQEYGGTFTLMPNFGFRHCLRYVPERAVSGLDLGSLAVLGNGSELADWLTIDEFGRRFSGCGLRQNAVRVLYGMAENAALVSATPPGGDIRVDWVHAAELRRGYAVPAEVNSRGAISIVSCGTAAHGTRIAVWNGNQDELPERELGEVAIWGDSLFSGKYHPGSTGSSDLCGGWFRTGDEGYMFGGELYVCGRRKDTIVVRGENVQPEQIEAIAYEALGKRAKRVAACGVPDVSLGTEGVVLICETRRALDRATQNQLSREIRESVRFHLALDIVDIRWMPSHWIEVTTSGKIARGATAAKYVASRLRPARTPPWADGGRLDPAAISGLSREQVEAWLCGLWADTLDAEPVGPDDNLLDLGGDSITVFRALTEIESQFGRTIAIDSIEELTVRNLAILLDRNGTAHEPAPVGDGPSSSGRRRHSMSTGSSSERRSRMTQMVPQSARSGRLARYVSEAVHHGPVNRAVLVPYPIGVRLQRAVLLQARTRSRLFDPQIELLSQWFDSVQPTVSPECIVELSLIANTWVTWREQALRRPDSLARWTRIVGGERLAALLDSARGAVLVVQHTPQMWLVRELVRERKSTIVRFRGYGHSDAKRELLFAHQLIEAQRVVERGGVAVFAGDGFGGRRGVHMPFFGHSRLFRSGAAELA